MLFDFQTAGPAAGDALIDAAPHRWGVDSEYGRLTDVMLAAPRHLEIVPCNTVSIENHGLGLTCSSHVAGEQHAALVRALEAEGVRCHLAEPRRGFADLAFTRDSTLMTPWGLLGLRPAVQHRIAEVGHIRREAARWGVPLLPGVANGFVEGGDVCLLRPGIVVIGYSGERTDAAGARSLASVFEARGWRAILTRFDPDFLHLDTLFTMVDRNCAVACADELEPGFIKELDALGTLVVPASRAEVRKLGANLFSLGQRRVLSPAGNDRVAAELRRLGYRVIQIEIDQFTRCGGGIHCLTMPLARLPG
jgi:N-dimethylarginine dimethylaminohydrolase